MKQFITAICAALVTGCSFGVTFAPKEYVDRMDATNRNVVIEYVNAEVANLVRKDDGGYVQATNRAMSAIRQHQSLEPSTNYTDVVAAGLAPTNHAHATITDGTNVITTTREVYGVISEYVVTNYFNETTGALPLRVLDMEWGIAAFGDGTTIELFFMGGSWNFMLNTDTYLCEGSGMDAPIVTAYTEPPLIFTRQLITNKVIGVIGRLALTNDIPSASSSVTPQVVTNIVRDISRGGVWDKELEVWWTPIMEDGALRYVATTNIDLEANP